MEQLCLRLGDVGLRPRSRQRTTPRSSSVRLNRTVADELCHGQYQPEVIIPPGVASTQTAEEVAKKMLAGERRLVSQSSSGVSEFATMDANSVDPWAARARIRPNA